MWHVSAAEAYMIKHAPIFAALALTACSASQPDAASARAELRKLDASLGQAIDTKDAAAIAPSTRTTQS